MPITASPLASPLINCAGDTTTLGIDPLSVSGGSGLGFTYSINFGNRIPIDSIVSITTPGPYTLLVFDSEGCQSGDLDIFIDAPPEFTVDLGADIEAELGSDILTISADIDAAFPIDSIIWTSDDAPFECLNNICDSIQIFPVNSTTFTSTIIDINAVSYTHLTLPTKA